MGERETKRNVLFVFSNTAQRDLELEKILKGITCRCRLSSAKNNFQVLLLEIQKTLIFVHVCLLSDLWVNGSDATEGWAFKKMDVHIAFFALALNDAIGYSILFDLFLKKKLNAHLIAPKIMISLPLKSPEDRFVVSPRERRRLVRDYFYDYVGPEFRNSQLLETRITSMLIREHTQTEQSPQLCRGPSIA